MLATDAENAVRKSIPLAASKSIITVALVKYARIKNSTDVTVRSGNAPPTFVSYHAEGCKSLSRSATVWRKTISARTNLMPPPVEPLHAVTFASSKINNGAARGQAPKSVLE